LSAREEWRVGVQDGSEVFQPDGIFDASGERVASVYGVALNTPLSEQPERFARGIARAHLIAAAPAMREALEIVCACGSPVYYGGSKIWTWTHPDGRTWCAPAPFGRLHPVMHPLASAALALARGEGGAR
jgi:hypothetical protein